MATVKRESGEPLDYDLDLLRGSTSGGAEVLQQGGCISAYGPLAVSASQWSSRVTSILEPGIDGNVMPEHNGYFRGVPSAGAGMLYRYG